MDTLNTRFTVYGTLIDLFGDKVKELIEKRSKELYELEQTRQGNQRLKKEMERIKATGPQKTLKSLLDFQTLLSNLEDTMEPDTFTALNEAIANPDDDNNIFTNVTELIATCDYTDETLKPERKYTHHHGPVESLTEAQKLIRANDPEDYTYTMCVNCKRCMTTAYYNAKHKGRHVCRRSAEAQVVAIKEKSVMGKNTVMDLTRLQLHNTDEINASFAGVSIGGGRQAGDFLSYKTV